MKLHSVVRIGLLSLMLVGAFIAGQRYRAPRLRKAPRSGNTRLSVVASAAPVRSPRSTS